MTEETKETNEISEDQSSFYGGYFISSGKKSNVFVENAKEMASCKFNLFHL